MTPTQFSAKTRNIAKTIGVNPQLVQRHYMMDKFLERISESQYKNDFILKGGFLIGSKYGINTRTTVDLDTTLQGIKGTERNVSKVFTSLVENPTQEGIQFEVISISLIREEAFYPGFQIKLIAHLDKIRIPFKMDITTGDSIYPAIALQQHKLMFEDKTIEILAYPAEQVIAEKICTTFNYGSDNSRAKDFYDLYIIPKLEVLDYRILYKSVRNTFDHRGNNQNLKSYYEIEMDSLKNSLELKSKWEKYQLENSFAKDILYSETIDSIQQIMVGCIEEERMIDRE